MLKSKAAIAAACIAAVFFGCSAIQEATGGAQELTGDLLSAINTSDYGAIRGMMTSDLAERSQLPDVESTFAAVREQAGVCGSPVILSFRSNVNTSGSRLALVFAADCALGTIQGSLNWKTEEGVRKLESFSILRLLASSESVPSSETSGEVAVVP